MRNRLLRILVWLARKIEPKPEPSIDVNRLNGKVILPDHLSSNITSMRIVFDEPVSPARVMENLADGLNSLPDREFILYDNDFNRN